MMWDNMNSIGIDEPGLWMHRIRSIEVDGLFKTVTTKHVFDEKMNAKTIRKAIHPEPDPPNRFAVPIVEYDKHAQFIRTGMCRVEHSMVTTMWHDGTSDPYML